MSNVTTSPKAYPAAARNRGDSGGSGHLAAPRPVNGTSTSLGAGIAGAGAAALGAGNSGGPGSFSASLRSVNAAINTPFVGAGDLPSPISPQSTDKLEEQLEDQLNQRRKYKEGAENLLLALGVKGAKDVKKGRSEVEKEYLAAKQEIAQLENQLEHLRAKKADSAAANSIPVAINSSRADVDTADQFSTQPSLDESSVAEEPEISLTDLLNDLEDAGNPAEYYIEKANLLVDLFKNHPNLKYEVNWHSFGHRLHSMLLSESREVVAAGYRVTRYAITDVTSLRVVRQLNTDYVVTRSLVSKSSVEKEQALKFVRAFLEVPGGVAEISRGVVRAIVACAEQADDRLRGISIETLAEMLLLCPELIVSAGGVRMLTQVMAEGPWELADTLSSVFLYLLDMPSTRKYVRCGHDLEVVFSAFTDSCGTKPVEEERLRSSAKVISSMLKTWPGILCLSMFNLRTLKSLVASLTIPDVGVRDVLLELFFDIFRIKPPSWSSTFLAGRRLTTYGRVANLRSEAPPKPGKGEDKGQGTLVDHFISLLLAAFMDAGLLETLVRIIEDPKEATVTRKSTLLLGEVLKLCSELLPNTYSAKLQLLPGLFSSAARFGVRERFVATAAVYQIDSLNKTLHRTLPSNTPQHAAVEEEKRGQRQIELKMKLNLTIDDRHFSNLIVDTGVLTNKNYLKWNWDALNEMIQGPLLNPKRLEEAIKVTKFMKRLMSFYRPFKYKFSNIKNTKPNQRYVKTGCALFHTLLQTTEGQKFLGEHKILRQIAECLAQLDKMSGIVSPEPLFSSARINDTLSCGYFAMLGTLSADSKGLAMMERWRMFNMFYHITDFSNRSDIIKLFVSSMNFTIEGHPRILLAKALTTGPDNVRLFTTNHLRSLTFPPGSTDVVTSRSTETAEWAIRLLITQLYDPNVEVCETAVKILEEACNSTQSLEYIVKCRPTLDHLGEIGAPLLLRFLSTSVGYHYLNELDYINREMDDWFHGRNDSYVLHVEASLARAFADEEPVAKAFPSMDLASLGSVPPHFYRELVRTEEGCKFLREKGHFEDFVMFIREHGQECEDPEIVTKVKGCLWAVGNIGSVDYGAPFLDEVGIVESIVQIAETSPVLTLKGTAFYVLGLISKTMQGLEILLEYGWDCTTSTMGETLGFCIPLSLPKLLSVEPWEHADCEMASSTRRSRLSMSGVEESVENKILRKIADLSNHIKEGSSVKELLKLKSAHPAKFMSSELYAKAMGLLESYRFRYQMRRFVMIDLFDKCVVEALVKDGRSETTSPSSPVDFRD